MKLKEIRKLKKLKQKDVAEYLGIPRSTYNGYEQNISEPSFDTLIKLAKYFNVTTDEILGAKKEEVTLSEKKNLLKKINLLTEDECFKLSIYADGLMSSRVERKQKINNIITEEEPEEE